MANLDDYDEQTVAACRSVLLEVLTILGKHRDHLVVVGGWVPSLLFPDAAHVGSIDVDLAVNPETLPPYVYETMERDLLNAGYRHDANDPPSSFRRGVQIDARRVEVKVDLITGSKTEGGPTHRILQGIPVWVASGVEIAFESATEHALEGCLPQGERNSVRVKIASAAAGVVMKSIALDERQKEKDAYDLCFYLTHHPGGIDGIVNEFEPIASHPIVRRAMRVIAEKFATIDHIGPVWAARVTALASGDYELARRDAFEFANELVRRMARG